MALDPAGGHPPHGQLIVDPETSARLGRIRQHRTRPEILVRRALHRAGQRFRVHNRDLPGSPDIANRRKGWAIFVHGCFWHQHEGCRRATLPKRNRDFWLAKFAANRDRDRRAVAAMEAAGFTVLTVWECEAEAPAQLDRVLAGLSGRPRGCEPDPGEGGPASAAAP